MDDVKRSNWSQTCSAPCQQQLEFLRSQGCDEIQGYFFSRPLPYERLVDLLARLDAAPRAAPGGRPHDVPFWP